MEAIINSVISSDNKIYFANSYEIYLDRPNKL